MNFKQLILPALALGATAALLVSEEAVGYSTIGGSLGQTQRDFRLYNNFTAASANNNTTADANWPGYDGAEMAIWKACGEWASELHGGNGLGDPLQTVGSGGANFDPSWQGNATGIGGTNDNIHSEITGSSGGVLAYTETPISDGWRIRYYQNWSWQDGPGSSGGIDIQGVACHEYGHALGLGHSTVGGATMYPSISGTGSAQRSIEADDIAGVQFIYGVKAGTKPHIGGINVNSGQVTISGSNFSPTNNEVWFTQLGSGGNGTPIKVMGVTSNGTSITVTIPATAGEGDVLVRNNGTAHSNLSNAFPIDPGVSSTCNVLSYCTGKVSSTGFPASIGSVGTPSFSTQGFSLSCFNGGVPNVNGIHFWSNTGTAATPFANGLICLAPPTIRGPVHTYDSFGFINVPITVNLLDIGVTRWFQFWFRDLSHPDGTGVGLSDGLEVLFCN
jgi:hypothetical protein